MPTFPSGNVLNFVYMSENVVSKHVDLNVGQWLLLYHTPVGYMSLLYLSLKVRPLLSNLSQAQFLHNCDGAVAWKRLGFHSQGFYRHVLLSSPVADCSQSITTLKGGLTVLSVRTLFL